MEQINSARGSLQVIRQKSQLSTSSQKVVETWSQELKTITKKKAPRKRFSNGGFFGSRTSLRYIHMHPRGSKLLSIELHC
jgi:hypothetical protein